jgi:probable rRNA maturation factor
MTKAQAPAGRVFVQNRYETTAVSTRLVSLAARCAMGPLARRYDVSIVIADARTVSRLNKRFTGRNRPTDVLAFPICGPVTRNGAGSGHPPQLLGEVIVSPDEAKRLCGRYGLTFPQELVLYVIHGILHLRGHDDHNDADRLRMRKAELRVMKRVFPGLRAAVLENGRAGFVGTAPRCVPPRECGTCGKLRPKRRR